MDNPTQTDKLSDAEKREYDMKRLDFFKGTIAVVLIYATVIILICAVGIFSDDGYRFLFQDGYVFIVTLVIGVLLIVGLLLYQIYTYKQMKQAPVVSGDKYVCPDYWELKKTPDDVLTILEKRGAQLSNSNPELSGNLKSLSNYYCENTRNPSVNNAITINPTATDANQKKLKTIVENVYGNPVGTPDELTNKMSCSLLYPAYMEVQDTTKDGNKTIINNDLRCEYLRQCNGVVWSSICPNP